MLKQFDLLDIEIEALKNDQSIYGVLLSGSLAYEKATEYSDIDLIVLSNKNEFVSRRVEGILIEEHFHTYEKLGEGLDKNPAEVYKYIYSKILFDDGRLADLIKKAQFLFDHYKTPMEEKGKIKYWLTTVKDKLKGAISNKDSLKISYLLSTSSWEVLKGVWAVNDKPMPPSSIAFAFHHSLAVAPFDKWFETLFDKDINSRAESMLRIIDWIMQQAIVGEDECWKKNLTERQSASLC